MRTKHVTPGIHEQIDRQIGWSPSNVRKSETATGKKRNTHHNKTVNSKLNKIFSERKQMKLFVDPNIYEFYGWFDGEMNLSLQPEVISA